MMNWEKGKYILTVFNRAGDYYNSTRADSVDELKIVRDYWKEEYEKAPKPERFIGMTFKIEEEIVTREPIESGDLTTHTCNHNNEWCNPYISNKCTIHTN